MQQKILRTLKTYLSRVRFKKAIQQVISLRVTGNDTGILKHHQKLFGYLLRED